jgi:hypothetical protein
MHVRVLQKEGLFPKPPMYFFQLRKALHENEEKGIFS